MHLCSYFHQEPFLDNNWQNIFLMKNSHNIPQSAPTSLGTLEYLFPTCFSLMEG